MDIKPVAYEYRQRIGVDDEEIIITHQPPDRVQRVELYEVHPLYPESALLQAREEGRREGMREAAQKYKSLVEVAEKISANIADSSSLRVWFEDLIALKNTVAALNKEPPKEIDPNKWAFDRKLESY